MRGTRLGGTSKRVCDRHAEILFNLVKKPVRRAIDHKRRATDTP